MLTFNGKRIPTWNIIVTLVAMAALVALLCWID